MAYPYRPNWIAPAAGLAAHYALVKNNPRRALEIIDKVVAGNPEFDIDNLRFRNLAIIYHLAGRYEEGRRIYARIADAHEVRGAMRQVDRLGLKLFSADLFAFVGHIALLDVFHKAKVLGILPPTRNVIFGDISNVANRSYFRYWENMYSLVTEPSTVAHLLDLVEKTGLEFFAIRCTDGQKRDLAMFGSSFAREVQLRWEAEQRTHLLNLEVSHKERGYRLLRELGVPEGAWFAGLHVREGLEPMREGRNADVLSYGSAVAEIARRGGWVLRVGNKAMTPLPAWPNTIDFAHHPQHADWMDVFIWGESRFLIGTGSGPQMISLTFGKPVVITNWSPLRMLLASKSDILLPKHYWHEAERRFLTMAERLGTAYGIQESVKALADDGIKVINNTPEEILDAVIDMIEQTEGRLRYTERECELQNRFAETAAIHGVYPVRLARGFLTALSEVL